jgi:hypothetical protein
VNRLPTWLKILLPILVVVVLLAAVVTRVAMEEVPAHAQPAVLEDRFAEQVAFLREMAESLPMNVCTDDLLASVELDGSADPDAIREDLQSILAPLERWNEQVTAGWPAIDAPVVLSADIVQFCNDSGSTFVVKPYEAPSSAWSTAIFTAADQQPPVSLWFAGTKRQVRYNVRVGGSDEDPLVIRLTLDLEAL